MEKEDGVLVIRRIHVTYHLRGLREDQRDTAERVHEMHHARCPVYRTLHRCIDVTTVLDTPAE